MKKYRYSLYALLLFGLISFSEGNPCPERTRPHKTQCNAYYKCTELNDKLKYVWVPAKCEEGLVYEHSLGVCVLPADDWECGRKSANEQKTSTLKKYNRNKDADIYIVPQNDDEIYENSINDKYDDGKVEIIIGTGISSEEEDNNDETLDDGSGNGGELVELEGLMQAENRESEDVVMLKDDTIANTPPDVHEMEKKEELAEMFQTIKTKAEIGQATSNIDPKLSAHLQRLSQLIDGLKQTYQTQDENQPMQDLRPDQLNAFLAHFNIKNKFDNLDPNEVQESTKTNKTNKEINNKNLGPETKVVLSNILPKRYVNQHGSHGVSPDGSYSNSQIVVNRPEGAVLFTLPTEHHFVDHSQYSSNNSPKISEDTLKTVLELSKQMIASQNVPNIMGNPAYYAPPIMQPILLTPHIESPFSSNYYSNSPGSQSVFSSDFHHNHNFKYHKKPAKRPQDNPTTIIHNNVIPVHLSSTGSGEKEVLDSYGQGLYPPFNAQGERPDINADNDNSYHNNNNQQSYGNNNYNVHTTKKPVASTSSPIYGNTHRPFEFQPTSSNFNQYFTPSEHLNNQNINNIFQTTDNYGNVLKPMKGKRPNSQQQQQQSYQENSSNYDSDYSQMDANQPSYQRPNAQAMYSDDHIQQHQPQYPESVDEDDSDVITYSYGQKKPFQVDGNLQLQYPSAPSAQSIFSSNNNPYMGRPSSSSSSSSSHSGSYNNNKYSAHSQPAYSEGAQLVNVGGNFISFDVFQNSILPLMGGNAQAANVEVITCAAGVRQPNTTDCTRYYVCSKKDGKVLSYSCPPYTAFNGESRICDARTYALCNPDANMLPTYSVSENKRLQMETLKTLQDAKRKQGIQQMQQQQQALQAQQLNNILQQYRPQSSFSSNNNPLTSITTSSGDAGDEQNMLQSYMQQAAAMASLASTTSRPYTPTQKKRKYYCKEGDKIADQTSISNYFVCFKNSQGQMKGHKMSCSKGLLFCPKTTMCTLPSKCS